MAWSIVTSSIFQPQNKNKPLLFHVSCTNFKRRRNGTPVESNVKQASWKRDDATEESQGNFKLPYITYVFLFVSFHIPTR